MAYKKGELAKKRLLKKQVKKITEGLLSATTDLLLFSLYLPAASLGTRPTRAGVDQTFDEAYQMLEELNYKTIKRALYQLKKQGLIESSTNWLIEPFITQAGKKRLESLLPFYDEKRKWNGHLYLVNYDIEVKRNRLRDVLRESLRKVGSVKLQNSLYLCFYNPHNILKDFLEKYHLKGTVLVSELGKKGFLGKGELKEFLWQTAELEELNQRYQSFLEKYQNKKEVSKIEVSFAYYSLLQDDPQLPFELLPDEYLGDKAFLLFQKLTF